MRSILKSKKGISPILATLLLIVIAVAAVIVTYAWVMTFTSSTTNQAGAILTVENTRFYTDSDTDYVEVILRNAGTGDAKIVEVYAGASQIRKLSVKDLHSKSQFNTIGQTEQDITLRWPPKQDKIFHSVS